MFVAVVINVRYESLFLKWVFVVQIAGHQPSFVNELKLSDFKQVLTKYNINSEFSGGVLWCCDNTVAVRRVSLQITYELTKHVFLVLIPEVTLTLHTIPCVLSISCIKTS